MPASATLKKSVTVQPAPAQFNVAAIGEGSCTLTSYTRRDFYKITLVIKGTSCLQYASRDIEVDKSALVFSNPMVPYSWDSTGEQPTGYFCVFTEEFLQAGNRIAGLQDNALFRADGNPVYLLDDAQVEYLSSIFARMRAELDSDYIHKQELLRSHVHLVIHEALKMQPAIANNTPPNAAARITKIFLTLLERQFPVDSPQHPLLLKKASDYAQRLSVHVNHLNAAVHEVTGKSTTAHINERIVAEAKSLLIHTDWSAAEIAFSLGFEYASYFNNFFKKHTGNTPLQARNGKLADI